MKYKKAALAALLLIFIASCSPRPIASVTANGMAYDFYGATESASRLVVTRGEVTVSELRFPATQTGGAEDCGFESFDINLDGDARDIRFISGEKLGVKYYRCYFYNAESDSYEYSFEFSQLGDAVFDAQARTVTTRLNYEVPGEKTGSATSVYSIDGGKLIPLQKSEVIQYHEENMTCEVSYKVVPGARGEPEFEIADEHWIFN